MSNSEIAALLPLLHSKLKEAQAALSEFSEEPDDESLGRIVKALTFASLATKQIHVLRLDDADVCHVRGLNYILLSND